MNLIKEDYEVLKNNREEARQALREFLAAHKSEIASETTNGKTECQTEFNKLDEAFTSALGATCDYLNNIAHYSKFDSTIIPIIAELMSIYEGMEHIPKDRTIFNQVKKVAGKEKKFKKRITFITPFYVSGSQMLNKGLILKTEELAPEDISEGVETILFYYVGYDELVPSVNYDNFPYVKDYIDSLISYRLYAKRETISEAEMRALMKQFVENRVEAIELYQKTKIQRGPLFGTEFVPQEIITEDTPKL